MTAGRSDFGLSAFSARSRISPGQLSEAMPLCPICMKLLREVSGPVQRTRGDVDGSELMARTTYAAAGGDSALLITQTGMRWDFLDP